MKTITVNLDTELLVKLNNLVSQEIFPNRSECIRAAIRNLLLYYGKLKLNQSEKITDIKKEKDIHSYIETLNVLFSPIQEK
ncbi:MAG: ribbon-helix-helix domain-containing protein [Candidatus Thorarchaeota archaeon]